MADENKTLVFGDDDMILPDDWDENANSYDVNGPDAFAPTGETTPITEEATESNDAEGQATEAQNEEVAEEAPVTEQNPVTPPATVRIKYNHEERDLSLDEAAILAQKGLNYDKIEERLRSYEAMRNRNLQLAKDLGYETEEEMISAAEANRRNKKIRELVDAGNTEAMAKFLVDQEEKERASRFPTAPTYQQEQPTPAPQPTNGLSAERKAELDEFVRNFPGVTKLPDEVIAANRSGVRLTLAYERYQNKIATQEKDRELAILRQNQAAAAKAPVVGATGMASTQKQTAEDPFLKGFNADENWYQ